MMFLLRTAFWLTVIILLLPNDEQQRSQIYGTAQAAVNDVTTFCERNPSTCASGQEAFAVLVQKAQYGAELLMDLMSKGGDESASFLAPLTEPVASTEAAGPALWERADSQDTLSAEDREVAWGAPDSGV
jgi:hypothetical protein